MDSRRLVFAAIHVLSNVHFAETIHEKNKIVDCDMTREEAFKHYADAEIIICSDSLKAKELSKKQFFSKENSRKHPSQQFFETYPTTKSNKKKLLEIYGEDKVVMKPMLVTVLFQLAMPEQFLLAGDIEAGIKISEEEKNQLTLESILVAGVMIFHSEKIIKFNHFPLVINIIEHEKITTKQRCLLM